MDRKSGLIDDSSRFNKVCPDGKKDKRGGTLCNIAGTRKYQNRILVFWTKRRTGIPRFFPVCSTIDIKINARDLAQNPKCYRIRAKNHAIESSV